MRSCTSFIVVAFSFSFSALFFVCVFAMRGQSIAFSNKCCLLFIAMIHFFLSKLPLCLLSLCSAVDGGDGGMQVPSKRHRTSRFETRQLFVRFSSPSASFLSLSLLLDLIFGGFVCFPHFLIYFFVALDCFLVPCGCFLFWMRECFFFAFFFHVGVAADW